MALDGVNADTESSSLKEPLTPSSIVFARMSPEKAHEKLYDYYTKNGTRNFCGNQRLWLMRESCQPGCLTIDTLHAITKKKTSKRFALVREDVNGNQNLVWKETPLIEDVNLLKENKLFVFMSMTESSATEDKKLAFKQLLKMLEDEQYVFENNVSPSTRQEQARNNTYVVARQVEYIQERVKRTGELSNDSREILEANLRSAPPECPISLEPITEGIAAITLQGQLYSPDALAMWLVQNGTDPLTRKPLELGSSQVLLTQGPKYGKEAREKAEELLKTDDEKKKPKPP